MRRHEPIGRLTAEPILVYRCGTSGQRYHSIKAAYLAAARHSYKEAYPCECEIHADYDQPDYYCGCHDRLEDAGGFGANAEASKKKLIPRLARWLRWRDGRMAQIAELNPHLLQALEQLGGAEVLRQLAAAAEGAASFCDPGKAGGDAMSRRWERVAAHLRAAAAGAETGETAVTLAEAAEVLQDRL